MGEGGGPTDKEEISQIKRTIRPTPLPHTCLYDSYLFLNKLRCEETFES